jgi:hypothetical protein
MRTMNSAEYTRRKEKKQYPVARRKGRIKLTRDLGAKERRGAVEEDKDDAEEEDDEDDDDCITVNETRRDSRNFSKAFEAMEPSIC